MESKRYKIKSSLSYGKVFWGKSEYALYIFLFLPIMDPIITIGIIITILLDKMQFTYEVITSVIFLNCFWGLIFGIVLWRFIHNNKLKKKIEIWLEDAVPIRASAKRLDLVDITYQPYQIEVSFIFKDVRYKYISKPGNPIIGYYKFFSEPVKELKILYSPKYEEVLILKDN